jgi:hypothetical protein
MRMGIEVCKSCHKAIHDLVPGQKELGRHHNKLETLLARPKIAKFIKWKRERASTREDVTRVRPNGG